MGRLLSGSESLVCPQLSRLLCILTRLMFCIEQCLWCVRRRLLALRATVLNQTEETLVVAEGVQTGRSRDHGVTEDGV